MNNRLKEAGSIIDIYQNKKTLKLLVFVIAIIIGTASIYYTNIIVEQLKQREQKLIDLYANTIEYAANENSKDNLTFLTQEIIVANNSIPVILTDKHKKPKYYRNIDLPTHLSDEKVNAILEREIESMVKEYQPIIIQYKNLEGKLYDYDYVYYKNSHLLNQLKYYPYIQLSVIFVFAMLAYLAFSYSKTAEQNRVWVGLAKETAHQLGTPLSSLMAWVEYFRSDPKMKDSEVIAELDKDIQRLEMITSRFSSIGSVPVLKSENLYQSISNIVGYLEKRISSKVKINITTTDTNIQAKINKPLFDWVIENVCKNAVDAMSGIGKIDIDIQQAADSRVIIDISDTGKGMSKSKMKQVFQPGFTTKQRGWGLGLTLVKRIVENYHKGRIFVKTSEIDQGTTFRIILNS
jgi:two-component sensor histidine kinase